jgi:hypothetical protein
VTAPSRRAFAGGLAGLGGSAGVLVLAFCHFERLNNVGSHESRAWSQTLPTSAGGI